ncbi:Cytochrome c oxidase assembly protein COX11, mitochondrial [Porphyridium purpureum]|uniref:Cytochrome c oxidase assembly protein COX11, mitochondrial n=1 Tax=Porphyridium purpureum TaxID=35688 RepID=A0A5J4Z312_PORPP|nr:Cytochrome c oxidase assembly protein COX11, mitochondrial [Porphyridium purpureum]|eukprot:POR1496..scf208_2
MYTTKRESIQTVPRLFSGCHGVEGADEQRREAQVGDELTMMSGMKLMVGLYARSARGPGSAIMRRFGSEPAGSSQHSSQQQQKHQHRNTMTQDPELRARNRSIAMWSVAIALGAVGMSYAAVPLYKMFCQATGFGGEVRTAAAATGGSTGGSVLSTVNFYTPLVDTVPRVDEKPIKITFVSDAHLAMPWKFVPMQRQIYVYPGETALAFYKARNYAEEAISGIATYNVTPNKAGIYFNKIQCFCFEEQRLNPDEEIEMPVFFYIDPEFSEDPKMRDVRDITLSYTFFRSDMISAEQLQAQAAMAWQAR